MEMSCKKKDGQWILIQKPIRELMEHASPISQFLDMKDDVVHIHDKAYRKAVVIYVKLKEEGSNELRWKLNGTVVEYTQNAGRLRIDNKSYHVSKEERELLFIVDDRILEVFSKQDGMIGTFETDHPYAALDIDFSGLEDYEIYEID
ncbi:MAG: hypothetical protein KBS83_07095 [Lachnospiraceae bacterium]|nr:hypothetical protein [Candidatus Equihabitans merdae]